MRAHINTSTNGTTTTVWLEGWLDALGAIALLGECASADLPLRLNLKGLSAVDGSGITVLRWLEADGAELIDASPNVQHMLIVMAQGLEGTDSK